jgi:multisubunit Na+/H+ antiporter MnhE subunit
MMSAVFFAVFSGLAWMGLRGNVGIVTFIIGIIIGTVLWRLFGFRSRIPFSVVGAVKLVYLGVSLFAVFIAELVLSNLQQLLIVLAPRIAVTPYWTSFRTELETPVMRALLGAMIVMTPGTVAYGESESGDGDWIINIHVLHAKDEADARQTVDRIRTKFESRIRQLEIL